MTETPHTQIPQALHAAMSEWGRHAARLREIDEKAAQIDAELTELQRRAAELGTRHRELGVQRHQVKADADFARSMVEHGCQLAGLPVPEQPPLPPAPLASHMPVQQAAPEPQLPAGVESLTPGSDVLGSPAGATIADPPDGGDAPEQPPGGFQPQPEAQPEAEPEAEPRRRRGGRRGDR